MKHIKPFWQKTLIVVLALSFFFFFWFSALSFVPVPWPDDSAFYFVAKDFFKWPPRWVMLPQAPFEPSYAIYNFNTMPLYPMLIGIGRWLGIDGPWALKFWPLGFFVMSVVTFALALLKQRVAWHWAVLWMLATLLDPILRWASVIVRPESLIGFSGVLLAIGFTWGWPKRFEPKKLWHPASFLLATAAYAHFNAIHLVLPVTLVLLTRPRELFAVGGLTALYLVPWACTVLMHPQLFIQQMTVQWTRLMVPNDWLKNPTHAVASLFQEMGSPIHLSSTIQYAGVLLWLIIGAALVTLAYLLFVSFKTVNTEKTVLIKKDLNAALSPQKRGLLFASAWILSSAWLWHNKPEVWFTYYLHLALFVFLGMVLLLMFTSQSVIKKNWVIQPLLGFCVLIFGTVTYGQWSHLNQDSQSWNWQSYTTYIDCIDQHLTAHEAALKAKGLTTPYQVWGPTFPDITIELSRRHPAWKFSRTCDFWERHPQAIKHGHQVEALVVSESLTQTEALINGPQASYPQVQSAWMNWRGYYLNHLSQDMQKDAGFLPERLICQVGKWQAFLFLK